MKHFLIVKPVRHNRSDELPGMRLMRLTSTPSPQNPMQGQATKGCSESIPRLRTRNPPEPTSTTSIMLGEVRNTSSSLGAIGLLPSPPDKLSPRHRSARLSGHAIHRS